MTPVFWNDREEWSTITNLLNKGHRSKMFITEDDMISDCDSWTYILNIDMMDP